MAPRELHGVEEHVLPRDLRPDGKLAVDGLGGSYGVERLTYYKMLPQMGPPETHDLGVSRRRRFLGVETRAFVEDIRAWPHAIAGLAGRHPHARNSRDHLQEERLPHPMIITRSPLRVSLGGGGTDLPSYYREHGGFLVAAAIDKYVYITQHRTFQEEIIIKYSKLERVARVEEIEHPIVREALKLTGSPTRTSS